MIDYVRGYFDAEGGVSSDARSPYVYFAQKDRKDLEELRGFLISLGLKVGRIHNPSQRVDPDYWRFCLGRRSLRRFVELVGSWHPRKSKLLQKISEYRVSGAHRISE
ncbi:MAG: LAGLIDADG family homing endonuclease [Thermoplasmata archaeon]